MTMKAQYYLLTMVYLSLPFVFCNTTTPIIKVTARKSSTIKSTVTTVNTAPPSVQLTTKSTGSTPKTFTKATTPLKSTPHTSTRSTSTANVTSPTTFSVSSHFVTPSTSSPTSTKNKTTSLKLSTPSPETSEVTTSDNSTPTVTEMHTESTITSTKPASTRTKPSTLSSKTSRATTITQSTSTVTTGHTESTAKTTKPAFTGTGSLTPQTTKVTTISQSTATTTPQDVDSSTQSTESKSTSTDRTSSSSSTPETSQSASPTEQNTGTTNAPQITTLLASTAQKTSISLSTQVHTTVTPSSSPKIITRPDFGARAVPLRFFVTINIPFQTELQNLNSSKYISYSEEFMKQLKIAFEGTPGFTYLKISNFRNGSTVCNYEIWVFANKFKQGTDYMIQRSFSNLQSVVIFNKTRLTFDENKMKTSLTKGSQYLLTFCRSHGLCPFGFQCSLVERDVQCHEKCFVYSNSHARCIHGDCVVDSTGNATCRCWTNGTDIYTGERCDIKLEEDTTNNAKVTVISVFSVIAIVLLLVALGVVLYRYKKLKQHTYDSLRMGLVDAGAEDANHWDNDLMDPENGSRNSQYDSFGDTNGQRKLKISKSGAKYSARIPSETPETDY